MQRRTGPMITLDGHRLDLDKVVRVARGGEKVRLSPAAAEAVKESRAALRRIMKRGTPAYGIKTGFGQLADVEIPEKDAGRLQLNLLRSHAVGRGDPLPTDAVRAVLLLRANTLATGYSGVRRELVDLLLELLNRGVHPVMPSRGSL